MIVISSRRISYLFSALLQRIRHPAQHGSEQNVSDTGYEITMTHAANRKPNPVFLFPIRILLPTDRAEIDDLSDG